MLRSLTIMLALSLPLVTTIPCRGAEKGPVTPFDADGLQLQALKETDNKLAGLAKLPAEPGAQTPAPETPKPVKKVQRKSRAKGRAKAHAADPAAPRPAQKPLGRRLTLGEVRAILASDRDLSGADLSGLDLSGADLSGANLSRTDLKRTNLQRADLSEADLELADLSNANLTRASLHMARLHGTRIAGARLDGALWTDRMVCRSGSLGKCNE